MSQGAQKNYLFVSNHCNHSKKLLQQLQNTKILNDLQIINIDDKRIQLPAFVQCVPTLYIPSKRHVITDSDLFQWINEALKEETSNKDKINMADITGDSSILPFQMGEMGSGLSGSAYSFIEEDKNDLMNQNYSFLQERDINKMPDFTRSDGSSSGSTTNSKIAAPKKTGGGTDSAYEQMMKSRGSDMHKKASPQVPNFSSPY
jgi:arsenate reductase-like glutaredoxin family protein